jgi:arylsulfatase A-like enzyme
MSRPNILLFLSDDHGPWALGCYGNQEVRSPHLDRLAAEGVRFQNAFTPSPVCSPARACLLAGRTPSQVGIHDWIQDA